MCGTQRISTSGRFYVLGFEQSGGLLARRDTALIDGTSASLTGVDPRVLFGHFLAKNLDSFAGSQKVSGSVYLEGILLSKCEKCTQMKWRRNAILIQRPSTSRHIAANYRVTHLRDAHQIVKS